MIDYTSFLFKSDTIVSLQNVINYKMNNKIICLIINYILI